MTFPKERCELSGVTCGYWVTYYKNLAERQAIELSHCAKRLHEQREEIKRLATIAHSDVDGQAKELSK